MFEWVRDEMERFGRKERGSGGGSDGGSGSGGREEFGDGKRSRHSVAGKTMKGGRVFRGKIESLFCCVV